MSRRSRQQARNRDRPYWFRWVILLCFVLSIFILFFFVLYPWRVRYWNVSALSAAGKNSWSEVETYAQNGLFWSPGDPSLEWVLLRARLHNRLEDAVAEELPELSGDLEPQALLAAAEIHQALGHWDLTAEILPQLANRLPAEPRGMLLFALQAFHEERYSDAVDWSRALVAAVPGDATTQLFVARTLLREEDLFADLRAVKSLFAASANKGRVGAEALDELVAISGRVLLSPEEQTLLSERIAKHPLASPRRQLFAASLRIEQEPENREAVVEEMVGVFGRSEPVELSRWLQSTGESERALAVLDARASGEGEGEDASGALQTRLGAYLSLGRDEEAMELLGRNQEAIGTTDSELIRFLLMRREANVEPEVLRAQGEKAVRAVVDSGEPAAMVFMARILAALGFVDLAIAATDPIDFEALSGDLRVRALIARTDHLIVSKRSPEAFELSERYRELMPLDPLLANNFAYLGMLRGRDVAPELAALREFVRARPYLVTLSGTLAIAALREGDIERARQLYQQVPEAVRSGVPASRLVGAWIDYESGNRAAAEATLIELSAAQFMPEEVAWMEELRAKVGAEEGGARE